MDWDQYFMAMAKLAATRSKDPNTQVGACIINKRKRVIGLGYNGMPQGNDDFSWNRDGEENKYKYVIHAEANAILNSIKDLTDSIIYTSLFPCNDCAKIIAQSGVKEVIYESDKYKDHINTKISKKILDKCGVRTRQVILKELIIK